MIGRINVLGTATLFGIIKADNGLSVRFDHSSVMAYDVTGLALDQLVSFDLENGPSPRAVNVCVRKEHPVPVRDEGRHDPMRLRYMGFEQKGAARDYRFDQVSIGGDTVHLVVEVAMTMFTKHHVGIQDGPALCLYVLNVDSKSAGVACPLQAMRSLSDADVQIYVESKVLAAAGSHRNRQTRPRAPAPEPDE
jgi:hypothetical protein